MNEIIIEDTVNENKSVSDLQKEQNNEQFLTFILGQEKYGIDILRVQEIRSWEPVSRIPNVPSYEKGVVNLRGAIVPITDLRERFNLKHADYTPVTAVIVVHAKSESKTRTMGVVVDAVSEVVDVDKNVIQSSPDFGAKVSTEFISGLAAVDNRMIILLDMDKLLDLESL